MNIYKQKILKLYRYFIGILFILWMAMLFIIFNNAVLDREIAALFYNSRTKTLDKVFIFITSLGNTIPAICITAIISIILFRMKRKLESIFYSVYVLIIFLINELIKLIIKRPRPEVLRLVEASGYSFPSGHAMVSMGAVLLAIYFMLAFIKNKKCSVTLSILAFIWVFLIGTSRIYVGVHYPSDVVGGWMFASAYALLVLIAYEKTKKKMEV